MLTPPQNSAFLPASRRKCPRRSSARWARTVPSLTSHRRETAGSRYRSRPASLQPSLAVLGLGVAVPPVRCLRQSRRGQAGQAVRCGYALLRPPASPLATPPRSPPADQTSRSRRGLLLLGVAVR